MPNTALQPTVLLPLRCGKPAAELRHLRSMRVWYGLCLLWIIAGSIWTPAALADWVVIGAATKCNPIARELVVVGIVEASDDDSSVAPPEGFTALGDGEHELRCMVRNMLVSATVRVYPPQARGMCMGIGYVSVDKFNIGGVSLFPGAQAFNWSCDPSEKPLMKISVKLQGSQLQVEMCRADWDWSTRYETPKCLQENTERFRAAFDCTKSVTVVEELICKSEALSRLDHDLFSIYQEAMRFQNSAVPLRNAQRQWLQQERGSCTDEPCVRRAYEKRIVQVRSLIPKVDSNKAVY